MATMMNETAVTACGRCGSTALHHVVYGMPTMDLFDDAQRRPEPSLGGCCTEPGNPIAECEFCEQVIACYNEN